MAIGTSSARRSIVTHTEARAVSPSNTVDLPDGVCGGLWIGGVGNLNYDTPDGTTVLISAIPAGTYLPIAAKRVRVASTTATLIVALY